MTTEQKLMFAWLYNITVVYTHTCQWVNGMWIRSEDILWGISFSDTRWYSSCVCNIEIQYFMYTLLIEHTQRWQCSPISCWSVPCVDCRAVQVASSLAVGWCSTGDAWEKLCSLMRVSGSVTSLGVATLSTTSYTIRLYSASSTVDDHGSLKTAEDIYN